MPFLYYAREANDTRPLGTGYFKNGKYEFRPGNDNIKDGPSVQSRVRDNNRLEATFTLPGTTNRWILAGEYAVTAQESSNAIWVFADPYLNGDRVGEILRIDRQRLGELVNSQK